MARHGIYVGPDDMIVVQDAAKLTRLTAFAADGTRKYDRFFQIPLDANATTKLTSAVASLSAGHFLKIFLGGHGSIGGVGVVSNAGQLTPLTQLADMLARALRTRCSTVAAHANTELISLSCLFARTTDGNLATSSAEQLQTLLRERGIYLTLEARTEITKAPGGHELTVSRSLGGPRHDWLNGTPSQAKKPYTKRRWRYRNDGSVLVEIRTYDQADKHGGADYIPADSVDGKRLLWAEAAVNEILTECTGQLKDERAKVLLRILCDYDVWQSPPELKDRLAALVDGTATTPETNFLLRSGFFRNKLGIEPSKARLIRALLARYP